MEHWDGRSTISVLTFMSQHVIGQTVWLPAQGTHSSGNSHRSVGDRGCSEASPSRLSRCLGSLADRGRSTASASRLSRCLGAAGFGYRSRWRSKNDISTETATTARPSKIGPRTYGTAVSRGWNQGGTYALVRRPTT